MDIVMTGAQTPRTDRSMINDMTVILLSYQRLRLDGSYHKYLRTCMKVRAYRANQCRPMVYAGQESRP